MDMHTRSRIIAEIVGKHYDGKEEKGSLRSNSAATRIMTDKSSRSTSEGATASKNLHTSP